jgi:response regulator of citrate/malate metabolism
MKENAEQNKIDVLIIDDDLDICTVMKEYLEEMGRFHIIAEANDGEIATRMLHSHKYQLIILDMNMPKKSGFELIKEFEGGSANKKENILVISGTLDRDLTARIIKRGVINFLSKPFDQASFLEKITKMVS